MPYRAYSGRLLSQRLRIQGSSGEQRLHGRRGAAGHFGVVLRREMDAVLTQDGKLPCIEIAAAEAPGNAGVNGGPAGDLFVTVAIRPHPIFTRNGPDVHVDIPISFAQAALGDTLQVPTIDGRIEYKIPEGTQTGTTFRMRGKGIQNVNGRGRGDQYVRVNIEVPKNLSDKQKKLLREFEETSTDENQVKRKSFWDKVKDALKDK